jgi:hypothetical protein
MARVDELRFEHSETIRAQPTHVLAAFFDSVALQRWWHVTRSVTVPRVLGVYAVEWPRTDFQDDVLGPLGGTFYGIVMDYQAGRGFLVADAYWLPPEGDPIGPMALAVDCAPDPHGTLLHVRQSGYEPSLRWTRYYGVVSAGWKTSLLALRTMLEDTQQRTG